MRELFVYWKAPRAREGQVAGEVAAAQSGLVRRHPHLQARLLHRADETGDAITWMETYTAAGGVSASLQAEIEDALVPLLARLDAGPRHTEVFESVA